MRENEHFFEYIKKQEDEKLTIYIIGYYMNWHHCKHLVEYLESTNKYNIVMYGQKDLERITDAIYQVEISKRSIVLIFQLDVVVKVIKKKKKTHDLNDIKVVNFNAETYYPPGCINPDYLITAYPEMLARYKKMNPLIFLTLKKYCYIPIFVNPKRFDYTCSKFNTGIYFKGTLHTNTGKRDGYNGGGHFRLYRDAYKERRKFIEDNNDLIQYIKPDYQDYDQWISTVEAVVTSNAYMSYFSKRPFENACAGAINILHVRDEYEAECLNDIGFIHLKNCIFVRKREDLSIFHKLSDKEKEDIRDHAYNLVMENYTTKHFWNRILRFIE